MKAICLSLLLILVGSACADPTSANVGLTNATPHGSRDSLRKGVHARETVHEASLQEVISDIRFSTLWDCDGNGLADSLDIAEGTADDVNNNGIIDYCDSDPAVEDFARNDSTWRQYSATHPNRSYFATAFRRNDTLRIRYTVPSPGGRVEVDVLDSRQRKLLTLTKESRQRSGHYELLWDVKKNGRFLPGGKYFIRLRALGREYLRSARWQ